ncbi:MAG: putative glycoside hydrolase [Eubacteriales bacterium]
MPRQDNRPGKKSAGRIAGYIIGGLLIVLLAAGWIAIQDAIVFTADGMRFVPELFFGESQDRGGTQAVTLPPATTAVTLSAELSDFAPASDAELSVEDTALPPPDGTENACGRLLSAQALAASDFASTARLLAASGETVAVIDLRGPAGQLGYQSSSSLAARARANASATQDFYLRAAVTALREQGITVIARIGTLADAQLADADESLRLLGADGKAVENADGVPLLDPSQSAVRSYLGTIVTEAASIGFDGILLDGCWLPEGAEDASEALEELVRSLRGLLGSRTLGLMLVPDAGGVQTETLLAYADALWTADGTPGARYEIDEAGRLTDSQDNEDTGGTL